MTVMRSAEVPAVTRRHRLESPAGLSVEVLENGALTALEAHGLSLLLYPSTDAEAGPANVHLRQRDGDRMRHVPLLGPASPSRVRVTGAGLQATGRWGALGYRLTLRPAERTTAWCWHLEVTNHGDRRRRRRRGAHPRPRARVRGSGGHQRVLRQPVPRHHAGADPGPRDGGRGATEHARAAPPVAPARLPDRRHGLGHRRPPAGAADRRTACAGAGSTPWTCPGARLQHEHALVALQDSPAVLAPGQTHRTGFAGILVEDHPDATGPADAAYLDRGDRGRRRGRRRPPRRRPTRMPPGSPARAPSPPPRSLACRPLTAAELTSLGLTAEPGSEERGPDGDADDLAHRPRRARDRRAGDRGAAAPRTDPPHRATR